LSNGVATAPEFDGVQDEDIGKTGYFVNRDNPEAEEYEFVNKLGTDLAVPA
jgi:hypothetical protein